MIFGSESGFLEVLGQQFQKLMKEIFPEKVLLENFTHSGQLYAEWGLIRKHTLQQPFSPLSSGGTVHTQAFAVKYLNSEPSS